MNDLEFDCGANADDSAVRFEVLDSAGDSRAGIEIGEAGSEIVFHNLLKLLFVRRGLSCDDEQAHSRLRASLQAAAASKPLHLSSGRSPSFAARIRRGRDIR